VLRDAGLLSLSSHPISLSFLLWIKNIKKHLQNVLIIESRSKLERQTDGHTDRQTDVKTDIDRHKDRHEKYAKHHSWSL
jgi:hypothetical protein